GCPSGICWCRNAVWKHRRIGYPCEFDIECARNAGFVDDTAIEEPHQRAGKSCHSESWSLEPRKPHLWRAPPGIRARVSAIERLRRDVFAIHGRRTNSWTEASVAACGNQGIHGEFTVVTMHNQVETIGQKTLQHHIHLLA